MMRFKITYINILIIVFLCSCSILNKEEGVPTFIKVESVIAERKTDEISSSHDIIDVWIGNSNEENGVYNIPSIVPILEFGEQIITFEAGITAYGTSASREKYFFYKAYLDTIDIVEGEEINVTPKFEYLNNTVFSELGSDDFESSVKRFKAGNNQIIEFTDQGAFEGQSAFVRNLNGEYKELEMITKNQFLIDNDKENAPVYLEFDYKSNIDSVGLGLILTISGETQVVSLTNFKTIENWKHFYINLTQNVNLTNSDVYYKIYFKGVSEKDDDYIGLDNLRLIYLEN